MDLKAKHIDLNCDMGEWSDHAGQMRDMKIMPYISSCNIACGGHAGDRNTMAVTVELAESHDVVLGAHPSYPDTEHFGRVVPDISHQDLRDSISRQLESLMEVIDTRSGHLHHIKPHGALYNQASRDEKTAELLVRLFSDQFSETPVYLPPGSVSKRMAEAAGLKVVSEVFADRRYEDDLSLRNRSFPDAVLHDKDEVLKQLDHLLAGEVITVSGNSIAIEAKTICLHSDTPGSIELSQQIHDHLKHYGIEITPP